MIGLCGGYHDLLRLQPADPDPRCRTASGSMRASNVALSVVLCLFAVWLGHLPAASLNHSGALEPEGALIHGACRADSRDAVQLRIYIGEAARRGRQPLYQAIVREGAGAQARRGHGPARAHGLRHSAHAAHRQDSAAVGRHASDHRDRSTARRRSTPFLPELDTLMGRHKRPDHAGEGTGPAIRGEARRRGAVRLSTPGGVARFGCSRRPRTRSRSGARSLLATPTKAGRSRRSCRR